MLEVKTSPEHLATAATRRTPKTSGVESVSEIKGDRDAMGSSGWQQLQDKEMSRWSSGNKRGSDEEVAIEMGDAAGTRRLHADGHAGTGAAVPDGAGDAGAGTTGIAPVEYKVYKRRWFGLAQLTLLNIIVSWDVSLPFRY